MHNQVWRFPIKILIADDHPLFRSGLVRLLTQLDEKVEYLEAASFDEALEVIKSNANFDLVLVDLLMPGMEPFKGIQAIVSAMKNVPVIVVSAVENRSDVLRTIDLGAMGYIPKSISGAQFIEMIHKVLDGHVTLPGEVLKRREPLTPAPQKPPMTSSSDARLSGLTKRQRWQPTIRWAHC